MGKKLNTLTQEQAEKIWDGRPKLPEKKILTFAHKQVFVNEQYFLSTKNAAIGMAIVPLAARMCRSTLRTCDYGRTNTQLAALHGITTPYAAPPAGTKSKPKTPGVAVVSWSTRQW